MPLPAPLGPAVPPAVATSALLRVTRRATPLPAADVAAARADEEHGCPSSAAAALRARGTDPAGCMPPAASGAAAAAAATATSARLGPAAAPPEQCMGVLHALWWLQLAAATVLQRPCLHLLPHTCAHIHDAYGACTLLCVPHKCAVLTLVARHARSDMPSNHSV
jgi:hypothetical protein